VGPPPVLCEDEGQVLVKRMSDCSRKGFPQEKLGVQSTVKQFVTLNQTKRTFKGNMPGNERFTTFPRRYPMLSTCISGRAASSSATLGESGIKKLANKLFVIVYLSGSRCFPDIRQFSSSVINYSKLKTSQKNKNCSSFFRIQE